jgi:methylglutaconyl-CoA hydratase
MLDNGVCWITLDRPDVHNAFNRKLIEELRAAFEDVSTRSHSEVRAVVLSGEGKSFCAGADVNWMRESLMYTEADNVADALRMAGMFDAVDKCPVPVIGRVHGAVLGGGVGLAAVCDIVVAAEGTRFAFSEAKLGIAPAVISPYVLRKIGTSHARALFFTAERFDAFRALQIGIVHIIKPEGELDPEIDRLLQEINTSAPGAIARAKRLIAEVPRLSPDAAMQHTAETIAALRVGDEGQEGLRAFLEKRKPGRARE